MYGIFVLLTYVVLMIAATLLFTKKETTAMGFLAALYWDSEMFGRSSKTRRQMEQTEEKDYKALLIHMFKNFDTYFDTPHKKKIAKAYKNFFLSVCAIADQKDYKKIYEGLVSGDPKSRTLRALYQQVYTRYIDEAKRERKGGNMNG